MNPKWRVQVATIAALAVMSALPASASADMSVESTTAGGLVVRGLDNSNDDIFLGLFREDGGRLIWFISTRRTGLNDLAVGAGCTGDFRNFLRFNTASAVCDRLAARVTVNLLSGNDKFVMNTNPEILPITDPLTVSGGDGNDTIEAAGGNDVLTGGAGNDSLYLDVGADNANGGAGNDAIFLATPARDATDQVNGGTGVDSATYSDDTTRFGDGDPEPDRSRLTPVRIIEADLETLAGEKDTNEGDVLRSIESYGGGAGNDIITGVLSSNNSDYHGGSGDDQLFGTSGNNLLSGGRGRDQLSGKAGNDTLDAKRAEGGVATRDSPVDCGAGTGDFAITDLQDALPVNCENFERSDAVSSPHVQMRFPRVVAVASGRISVRLNCPRAWRRPCAGTLELRHGRARTPRTRYAIKSGRSRRVSVRLGALGDSVGRRTVAQLVSLERGRVKGAKTTLRRIVISSAAS